MLSKTFLIISFTSVSVFGQESIPCLDSLDLPSVMTCQPTNSSDNLQVDISNCDLDSTRTSIYHVGGSLVFETINSGFDWSGQELNSQECLKEDFYFIVIRVYTEGKEYKKTFRLYLLN